LNSSPGGHDFWVVSPGIESLGRIWDFRANGYIPVGNKSWKNGAWAESYGCGKYEDFKDNTKTDHYWIDYEEVGAGADAEIGRKLFSVNKMPVKLYLDGYYFNMEHSSDVTGIGGRLTLRASQNLTFEVADTYDNSQHNVVMIGFKVLLNGLAKGLNKPVDDQDLEQRLYDPIERNLGTLGVANSIPTTDKIVDEGRGVVGDDYVFFEGDNPAETTNANVANVAAEGDSGDGTYENPYNADDLDQSTINEIESEFPDGSVIYLSPGVYDNDSNITLYNDQTIAGRSADYKDPINRDVYLGHLTLTDDDDLSYVTVIDNEDQFDTGITIDNADNVNISHVLVGSNNGPNGYTIGIAMNNSNVTISDSTIYGYDSGGISQANAAGIVMTNGGSLTISNSTVNGTAETTNADYSGNGYGIYADGQGETITVENNSVISGNGSATSGDYSGNGYGILIGDSYYPGDSLQTIADNTINIYNSTVTGTGTIGNDSMYSGNGYGLLVGYGFATGVDGVDLSVANNIINIYNSTLTGSGNNIAQSTFYDSGFDVGNGYGLLVGYGFGGASFANLDVTNNHVNVSSSKLTGSGIGGANTQYSGNGYGLAVGFGVGSIVWGGGFSVAQNRIIVDANSELTGTGLNNSSGAYSANGYGLLVGYGILGNLGADNVAIADNNVNIADSTLTGNGDVTDYSFRSGNGFGLLVGYGGYLGFGDHSVYNNSIDIINSTVDASTTGAMGSAYGINVGLHSTDAVSGINSVVADNDSFTINADAREGWGIWVDPDSDGNTLQLADNNSFTGIDIGRGGKVGWPDGSILKW
ncbi:MAG: hypothetical protein KAT71_00225, partial [Gammaproteobacteria bacterium]|nr:hypothetical protein [Gammaproteobacteria bacterium]